MVLEILDVEETEVVPITVEEVLQEQAENPFCKQVAKTIGSKCDRDHYGFLFPKWTLSRTLQRAVQKRLRSKVLYMAHSLRLAEHPGGSKMYYTLRRKLS